MSKKLEDFEDLKDLSLEKLIKLRDVQKDDMLEKQSAYEDSCQRLLDIQKRIESFRGKRNAKQ